MKLAIWSRGTVPIGSYRLGEVPVVTPYQATQSMADSCTLSAGTSPKLSSGTCAGGQANFEMSRDAGTWAAAVVASGTTLTAKWRPPRLRPSALPASNRPLVPLAPLWSTPDSAGPSREGLST